MAFSFHAKQSKKAVGYEHPARGEDHCGECRYFEKGLEHMPGECKKVAGEILQEDWCRLFRKKVA